MSAVDEFSSDPGALVFTFRLEEGLSSESRVNG
jgi:hypothetical protein